MSPEGQFYLQWGLAECVQISRWRYLLMGLLWPLLRHLYRRPLSGQSTDWWVVRRRANQDLEAEG